jgi:hypothetical protein
MKHSTGIQMHSARGGYKPAINVKNPRWPDLGELADIFFPGVPITDEQEAALERASQFAYDQAARMFWEDVPELVRQHFPDLRDRDIMQEGRSGGWLVLDLDDPSDWTDEQHAAWAALEADIEADIKDRCVAADIAEDIRANDWLKPHAARYNFITTDKGDFCRADIIADVEKYLLDKYDCDLDVLYPDRD